MIMDDHFEALIRHTDSLVTESRWMLDVLRRSRVQHSADRSCAVQRLEAARSRSELELESEL